VTHGTRAVVAFVVKSLFANRTGEVICDVVFDKRIRITGQVDGDGISLFDHDRGCQISGVWNRSHVTLYDHGSYCHLSIHVSGNRFEGYDYATNSYFGGEWNDAGVMIYDLSEGGSFRYS